MKRAEVLENAEKCVCHSRENEYGSPRKQLSMHRKSVGSI